MVYHVRRNFNKNNNQDKQKQSEKFQNIQQPNSQQMQQQMHQQIQQPQPVYQDIQNQHDNHQLKMQARRHAPATTQQINEYSSYTNISIGLIIFLIVCLLVWYFVFKKEMPKPSSFYYF